MRTCQKEKEGRNEVLGKSESYKGQKDTRAHRVRVGWWSLEEEIPGEVTVARPARREFDIAEEEEENDLI